MVHIDGYLLSQELLLTAEFSFFVSHRVLSVKFTSDVLVQIVLVSDAVELKLCRDCLADHISKLIWVV